MLSTKTAVLTEASSNWRKRHKGIDRWLRVFLRPARVLAAVTILGVVLVAVFAPFLAPFDPDTQDTAIRLSQPLSVSNGQLHVLGTDQLGRDVLSRLIYGARISLLVGAASVAISGVIGIALGVSSGYFRGAWDNIVSRLADIQLAFPFILLALSIIAILGPSVRNVIIVFGVTRWPAYFRTIRGATLSVRDREFVSAARAVGVGERRILIRHVLPNVLNPIIVLASFEFARVISSEAALSFLGLGVPPMIATWGTMISDGREYLYSAWWISTFAGLSLALLVIAINLLGDGLRDWLDPRTKIN